MARSLRDRIVLNLVPFLGYCILKLIYHTARKRYVIGAPLPQTPVIMTLWHGELGLLPFFYAYEMRKPPRLSVIISEHKDGELITRTVAHVGLDAVRGSSTRGGAKALIGAIRKMKEGSDIAITPDGPKGPRHHVHEGIVMLARKLDVPIVALSIEADRYWQFKSWDRFVLPKPFSKVVFHASKPFKITGMEMEEAKRLIAGELNRRVD